MLSFLQLTHFPQYSTFKVKIRVFWNVFSHLCLKSIQKNFQKLVWYSFFSFRVKIKLRLMAMRNFWDEIFWFRKFSGEIFMLRSLGYDLDTVVYTYSNTFFLLVFSESFGGFFGGGAFDVLKNVELLLVGFTISVEERIIPEHSSRVDSDYKYITTELKYDWWISKRPAIQIFPFSNVKMNLTIPAVKLFVRFYTE